MGLDDNYEDETPEPEEHDGDFVNDPDFWKRGRDREGRITRTKLTPAEREAYRQRRITRKAEEMHAMAAPLVGMAERLGRPRPLQIVQAVIECGFKIALAIAALMIALAMAGCVSSEPERKAEVSMYRATSPIWRDYVANDETIDDDTRDQRINLFDLWRARLTTQGQDPEAPDRE